MFRLVEQLESITGEAGASLRIRYGEWLAQAPLALLESRWERFSQLKKTRGASETERRLASIVLGARSRLDLHFLSREACWERLERTLEKCVDQDRFPDTEIRIVESCCEVLTANWRADSDLQARVKEWLAFDFSKESEVGHWRVGAAIRLAGLAGIRETVPRFLELFDDDWDWWNEEILRALVLMGDLDMVRTIADTYLEQPWSTRLYLAEVFNNLWIEGMDELIYPLLEEEKQSDGTLWNLGMALARYGSRTSMEAAAQIVNEFRDHPDVFPILKTLYSQYMVFDSQYPDVEQWGERIDEVVTRRADRQQEMPGLFSDNTLGFNDLVAQGARGMDRAVESSLRGRLQRSVATIRVRVTAGKNTRNVV